MNSLYIGVGVAIILALVTALVGPFFVDWGTHRALFEAEAKRIVGLPVAVLGDVDARLLPSPRVRFGDVVIGDLAHPVARVGRFELDLDVAGLIRGETRVSDLVLERPSLDLEIDAEGHLTGLPDRPADLSAVKIETVRLVAGRIGLLDRRSGKTWTATKIDGRGTVESLAGAWRLDATGLAEGRSTGLRIAARRAREGTRLRLQGDVDAGAATFTGDLVLGGEAGRPSLAGPMTLDLGAGDPTTMVAVTGSPTIDLDGVTVEDLGLRFGDEAVGVRLAGVVRARFGATPSVALDLTAKRLDLDGPAGAAAGPGTTGGAAARVAGLLDRLDRLGAAGLLPRDGRATIDFDTVALAGGIVSDVTASVSTRAGGLALEQFGVRLPGEGRLSLAGRFDRADRVFDGIGTLSVATPEELAAWWSGTPVGEARIGEITVSGPFTASRDGVSGSDLTLSLDGERAQGRVEVRSGGLLRLGLAAKRLDGRRLAALFARVRAGGLLGRAAGLDLDLDVGTIALEGVEARGARVALHVGSGDVTIDRLAFADLAGARLTASGRIEDAANTPKGRIEAHLVADRPEPAVRALTGLLAPTAVPLAGAVATAAGPVDLTVVLDGRPEAAGGTGDLALGVSGRAAGGEVKLDAHWSGRFDDLAHGRLEGSLSATGARLAPAAARLLDAKPNDRVILAGSIAGRAVEGLRFSFDAGLGDRRLTTSGEIRHPDGGAPVARLDGRLVAPDLGLLAGLVGRPVLALERRLPVDLRGAAEGWGGVWTIASLAGTIADTRIEAEGRVDLGGRRGKVEGRLGLDRADLATLVGAGLGAPFDFSLKTTVATLDLDDDRAASAVAATLRGEEGALRAADLTARFGAATLSGDLRARAAGTATTVSGRLAAELPDLDLSRGGEVPRIGGALAAEAVFEASGADRTSLIASLSGSGRLRLSEGRLFGVAPGGLKAPRQGEGSADQILRAMAGATTALPAIDLPLLVEGGKAQTPTSSILLPEGRATVRLSADLVRDRLDGLVTIEPAGEGAVALASAVSHALPTVGITLGGEIAAPRLDWATASLSAFLTLHALEREIEAADVQRQDRIERLRFSTKLKQIEERRRAREAPPAPMPPTGTPGAEGTPVVPPAAMPRTNGPEPVGRSAPGG